jgi:UDP-N-acetyl-D-mannosaminuronate dehydrogenase
MRVVVAGQGYVGLPLAVRAAQVGHSVVGFDVDEDRIERLASGESYVDDISSAQLREILDAGNFQPSSDPNGSTVLLLGLAYKKNTGDARESPARRVAQLLLDMGAEVRAAEPHVVEDARVDQRVVRVALTEQQIAEADAVVLLADHDAFDLDLVAQHARYVLDIRRRLSGPTVESL